MPLADGRENGRGGGRGQTASTADAPGALLLHYRLHQADLRVNTCIPGTDPRDGKEKIAELKFSTCVKQCAPRGAIAKGRQAYVPL